MANYVNGQMIAKSNDIEMQKEAYDTMTLCGYLAALFDANKVLDNGMAVNLTAEYNNFYGTSYIYLPKFSLVSTTSCPLSNTCLP